MERVAPDGGTRVGVVRRKITRRRFLGYSGATGLAVYSHFGLGVDPAWAAPGPGAAPTFTVLARRRLDQLHLLFEFWNLERFTANGALSLQKLDSAKPAFLVVVFQPQAIAERAFFKSGGELGDDAQVPPPPHPPPPPPPPGDEPPDPPPIKALLGTAQADAGNLLNRSRTRLAFEVAGSVLPMTYSLPRLLDWIALEPSVVPRAVTRGQIVNNERAVPGDERTPALPGRVETAIELPWRIHLSPHVESGWAHTDLPVTRDGRTELWHTRLGTKATPDGVPTVDERDDLNRTVRAIWALDTGFATFLTSNDAADLSADPFAPSQSSMTPLDRADVVRLSSDFRLTGKKKLFGPVKGRSRRTGVPFRPEVVEVERLILSSLGGWLDSSFDNELLFLDEDGDPNTPPTVYNTSLLQWRHQAGMGRDSYVRVVRKGYLCGSCSRVKASLITVTERQFETLSAGLDDYKGAYLRQQVFIVPQKAETDYSTDPFVRRGGRAIPFRRVRCLTKITPGLQKPEKYVQEHEAKLAFVPRHGGDGEPFLFEFRGTDWAGHDVTFAAPVVWVDDTIAYNLTDDAMNPIIAKLSDPDAKRFGTDDAEGVGPHVKLELRKARVAFATPDREGDTQFPVVKMSFAAEPPVDGADPNALAAVSVPACFPRLYDVQVDLSEAAAAGGQPISSPTFQYFENYLDDEFADTNLGGVIFELGPGAVAPALGIATKNAGGMAAPAFSLSGVSRAVGPIADTTQAAAGDFDPTTVFPDAVTILGGIVLNQVVQPANFLTDGGKRKTLTIVTTSETSPVPQVRTVIDWHPDLQEDGRHLFVPLDLAKCDMHAESVVPLDPANKPTFAIEGRLENFAVQLFGEGEDLFIRVPVERLTFKSGTGIKDQLDCTVGAGVSFHRELEYVDAIRKFLSFGDGSGLKTDVDGDGIVIEVRAPIPDLPLGVMSITDLALAFAAKIPFDASPVELELALSTRENPFSITVSVFGGGGFVGLAINANGMRMLELSFEFGGGFALSLGIASGKVEVKAGLYFKIETVVDQGQSTQTLVLEAYFRLAGSVDVLGLITVSVEFYLSLAYVNDGGDSYLEGTASVTVTIDVLLFSGTKTLEVRKKLTKSGSGGAVAANTVGGQPMAELEQSTGITFGDLLTEKAFWDTYCNAYAPVGA